MVRATSPLKVAGPPPTTTWSTAYRSCRTLMVGVKICPSSVTIFMSAPPVRESRRSSGPSVVVSEAASPERWKRSP